MRSSGITSPGVKLEVLRDPLALFRPGIGLGRSGERNQRESEHCRRLQEVHGVSSSAHSCGVDRPLASAPFRMGYEGVKIALAASKGDQVPASVDTGAT